jgi:hypothetical protein
MADDPYMAGRHPGEPIADYQDRMTREANDLGITEEAHKANLARATGHAETPDEPDGQ